MIAPAVAGLLTLLSLIVAIGAQNALVLRQGLMRSYVGPVVAVCALSDAVLISAGIAGVGTLVDRAGWMIDVVRWLGVAFLLAYAADSLRRARHPDALSPAHGLPAESRRRVLTRTVALTWLNPHVYLDVLLIGSIAAAHDGGTVSGRWWFGVGAALGSLLWFTGLGFGARMLAPLLARPRAWQVVEVAVAATMVLVAAKLALG